MELDLDGLEPHVELNLDGLGAAEKQSHVPGRNASLIGGSPSGGESFLLLEVECKEDVCFNDIMG